MFKSILIYGLIAGVIAGGMLSLTVATGFGGHGILGMALGYLTMLVALSAIFLAVKRHRDARGGGVIRFWPALGMGLGISFVAGIIYVAAWDITLAVTHMDFASDYGRAMVEQARVKGASAAELARLTGEMNQMKAQYGNPLYRWPMTFIEIFPVGFIVSLITAVLLRNPRFMPARG